MNLIYALINNKNYKVYVGGTINPERRLQNHITDLRCNRHHNSYLQLTWDKYGEGCFDITVLEFVDDVKDLTNREKFWINYFECDKREFGYNIRLADETRPGFTIPLENRKKMGKHNIGNKYCVGRVVSPETREKTRQSLKGTKPWNTGKKWSQEVKDKIGKGNLDKVVTKEQCKRMAEGQQKRRERERESYHEAASDLHTNGCIA